MCAFKILVSSDLNYNDLCAEIYYDDQFVGIMTQEQGFENLEIEIYPLPNQQHWTFKLIDFEEVIKSAKETLWEMRKEP